MRTTPVARGGLAAITVLAASLVPSAAHAYYRQWRFSGPESWLPDCAFFQVFVDDLPEVPPEQIMAAVTAAADAWSPGANGCGRIPFAFMRMAGPAPALGPGVGNIIAFRRKQWCVFSNGPDQPCVPYDSTLPAVLSVGGYQSGPLDEADIELNARDFQWANLDSDPGATTKEDIQNVLTHVFGGVLGFGDSCTVGTPAHGIETDEKNDVVNLSSCATAPPDLQASTLSPDLPPGDTSKRSLTPDDIKGVCDVYGQTPIPDGGVVSSPLLGCVLPATSNDAGAGADSAATQADAFAGPSPTDGGAGPLDASGAKDAPVDAGAEPNAQDAGGGTNTQLDAGAVAAKLGSGCGCAVAEGPSKVGGGSLASLFLLLSGWRLTARRRRRK